MLAQRQLSYILAAAMGRTREAAEGAQAAEADRRLAGISRDPVLAVVLADRATTTAPA